MLLSTVDAFADGPFSGNPAAVCVLDRIRPAAWLRKVAAEMNLSETAFLLRERGGWRIRWFTPSVEVDLCGHATLASAHVLWQERLVGRSKVVRFSSASGPLTARRVGAWIELDFPARAPKACPAPKALRLGIGGGMRWIGEAGPNYLVELTSESAVRRLAPDFAALSELGRRGVIVTARSKARGVDFVSRYFDPGEGIPEDPVTGSAHCTLGPYWSAKLKKDGLVGYQASARGGTVCVKVEGTRTLLRGKAVTILRGRLAL